MAVSQGFGKTSSTGLVFGYDTGDSDNSYRGAPGQNYAFGPNRSYGGPSTQNFENGKIFRSNGYTETVFIPTLGVRSVESIEIYNEYDGYGTNGNFNCCPNIFNYVSSGWGSFTWLPNTTYTYQIIYKSETGYTHPNYMYHYQYRANGSYITEYGVHTEGLRTHLGDGWYHAWNTLTTHPEAATGFCGMWHYEYYGRNKVSVAAVSIVPGTTIRPPRQFIDEGTTRTNTQGLLDLTGNGAIDLSNISYDSNGGLTFDGTDDYISVSSVPALAFGTGDFTAEVMIRPASFSNYTHMVALRQQDRFALKANASDGAIYYYDPSFTTYGQTPGWTLSLNQWNHVVLVRQNGTAYAYLNGVSRGSVGGFSSNFTETQMNIGWGWGGEFTTKQISVVKMYNRALSATEITQNYSHYKTRFNL
jgi:hypothetical protein